MIPLMLDTSKLRVLVIGAGRVGIRKARYFAGSGAQLTLLSRSFTEHIPGAEHKTCDIRDLNTAELETLIQRFDIIITALPDAETNRRLTSLAAANGIWHNSSDETGNFLIPAVFSEGDVTVAVSTGGKAPAVSAFLRDRLRETYPGLNLMTDILADLKTELKTAEPDQQKRAAILRAVLSDEQIWAAVNKGDETAARTRAGSFR